MGKGTLRNRPCKCGSKLKYKKCCLLKEQGYNKDADGFFKRGMRFLNGPVPSFDLGEVIKGDIQK